jgi:hypothetical protein
MGVPPSHSTTVVMNSSEFGPEGTGRKQFAIGNVQNAQVGYATFSLLPQQASGPRQDAVQAKMSGSGTRV